MMGMRLIPLFLSLVTAFGVAHAESEPAVGIWEKYSVTDGAGKLVARTNYVFTNQRLTDETVFTAIRKTDPLRIVCCVKVKNLKPLELKELLAKYRTDDNFQEHMKSIKGSSFIYEAIPVDKGEWNPMMSTIMQQDQIAEDLSPYHAPVIASKLSAADEKLGKLELGPTKAKLKISYSKDHKATYQFDINGKTITLNEDMFPH